MPSVAVMILAALLLVAVSAEAIKLGPLLGPGKAGEAYRNTLWEAVGNLKKQYSAVMRGDERAARKYEAEVLTSSANFVRDAGPAGPVNDVLGKVASTKSRIERGIEFAREKIARIFGGGGGNAGGAAEPDPRAALAVDKASRQEFVARSDIFDRQRLSGRTPVRVWANDDAGRSRSEDVWAEAEGGGWDDGSDAWSDNRAGRGREDRGGRRQLGRRVRRLE